MDAAVIVLVVVAVGVAAALAYASHLAAKRRREAFAALACSRGWSYVERDDGWIDRFSDTPFDDGHNRSAKNVVTGRGAAGAGAPAGRVGAE